MAPCQSVARDSPHSPRERKLVGLGRFELPTSRLSSARSNQLSYKPGSQRTEDGRQRTERFMSFLSSVVRPPSSDPARSRRKRNVDGGFPHSGISNQASAI